MSLLPTLVKYGVIIICVAILYEAARKYINQKKMEREKVKQMGSWVIDALKEPFEKKGDKMKETKVNETKATILISAGVGSFILSIIPAIKYLSLGSLDWYFITSGSSLIPLVIAFFFAYDKDTYYVEVEK